MKWLRNLFVSAMLCFPALSAAENTTWSLYGGTLLDEHPDHKYMEVTATYELRSLRLATSVGSWSNEGHICQSVIVSLSERWTGDLGMCLGGSDERVETDWSYRGGLGFQLKPGVELTLLHFSNGRTVNRKLGLEHLIPTGPKDKGNEGRNFIGLRVSW